LPKASEHISKAERNEKIADALSKTDFLDWTVTCLFYAALHYVDAILAASVIHPEGHTERNEAIGTNPSLLKIRNEYRTLETLSRNARYRAMTIEPSDLHIAQQSFDVLKAHLRSRLGISSST
jgi:hypothetical protein